MEDVLEAAAVLSVCKVFCSLPFLRSVSDCHALSFCCCCLLLFTDIVLTVFLGVLLLLDLWQTEVPSVGDAIALRSLLFVSHTYGVVLVLTLPALVLDSLVKLLQKQRSQRNPQKNLQQNPQGKLQQNLQQNPQGKLQQNLQQNPPPLGAKSDSEQTWVVRYDVGAYLCCLALWTIGSLSIRWRWRLEEVWTAACVFSSGSLLECLPNILTVRFLRCGTVLTLLAVTALFATLLISRKRTATLCTTWPDGGAVPSPSRCEVLTKRNISAENWDNSRTQKLLPSIGPAADGGASPRSDLVTGGLCLLILLLLPLNLGVNVALIISVDKVLQQTLKNVKLPEDVHHVDMV